jgi:hypothetical protein
MPHLIAEPARLRGRLRSLASLVCVFAAAVVVAGCGRTQSTIALAPRQQSIASPSAVATATEPAIADERLTSPFNYDAGNLQLSPPSATYSATETSAAAVTAFEATGLYGDVLTGRTPEIFLAHYRRLGGGPSSSAPQWDVHDVWVVRYTSVPDQGTGAGFSSGGPTLSPSPSPSPLHDIVAFVDASTGKCLSVISDLPD